MYRRTPEQRAHDLAAARTFEAAVAGVLPPWHRDETTSQDRLDFWIPGVYLEVKEKRQRLTTRWVDRVPGVPEADLMVIDELTIRRALRHWPEVYFLLRDLPQNRMFVASLAELICVERVRVNRVRKGKWLVDLRSFRQLESLDGLVEFVMRDMVDVPWQRPDCLGAQEVPQA